MSSRATSRDLGRAEHVTPKQYYIYVMMNEGNSTSYIGVTSDLKKRVWQHKQKAVPGFTERYNLNKLVYYEVYDDPESAIGREKQLKRWSRIKKSTLIKKRNPSLQDLVDEL